ncbi:hypothetical protein MJ563_20540 [Klebsiella pneumoniae]|nr:hypothetical protein MJ563_20540 [Klebsiella pneumoniae]
MPLSAKRTAEQHLSLSDSHSLTIADRPAAGRPCSAKSPKMTRDADSEKLRVALIANRLSLPMRLTAALYLPTVAEKTFLVTIGDRRL